MYVLVIYQWKVSFVFQMCVWKALVTGWWPGVCLVQLYLPRAIQCNQRDHAGLVCAYQKQPKMCMKWGQESCLKNVNNKRPFSTCFQSLSLTAPKVSRPLQLVLSGGPVTPTPIGEYNGLRGENRGPFKGQQASASNPVMWLWLAGLYVREALPHMLPATRYPATSWPTIPRGYSTAPQPVHTGRRPSSDCGLACWTMNPGSGQSYCSFNSHTNSNSALVKYNVRASGWTHSLKLYPNIKICVRHILEQLVGITNNFVCISVNEIYVETSCVSVLRCY